MIKFPLLTSEDIEVKVKQVTKSGALLLLYKTARVDARILDETVGVMNWTNEYKVIKDNLYCRVGIRENEDQDFVYKEDCGIESGQDDGNEKKAEASDAFKRCCSKLGIGRELYTSPQIWANVSTVEKNGKWYLSDPYSKYVVTNIEYNEDTKVITNLEICNAKSNVKVFSWKLSTTGAIAQKMVNTLAPEPVEEQPEAEKTEPVVENKPDEAPWKEEPAAVKTEETTTEEVQSLDSLISSIGSLVKKIREIDGNMDRYKAIVAEIAGPDFKCNKATEDDYSTIKSIFDRLNEVVNSNG